ncbi:MAG: signal peptidase II [Acidimicrobiales bacterium]
MAEVDDPGQAPVGRPGLTPALRWALVAGAAGSVLVLDQLTKWWARGLTEPIDLVGSLRFNLAFNSGAAFSSFQGAGSIIGVIGLVVVAFLLRASARIATRFGVVCMGMVIGGALGNLVDRVVQPGAGLFGGKVTDFIDLQWWPIFNVADMALSLGGLALVATGLIRPGGLGVTPAESR